jgi:hypothetical protein
MNLSQYDPLLKEFYEGALRETLNNEVLMLKHAEKSSRKWSGRRVIFPIHLGRNVGVGARAEAAVLPTAGYQQNYDSIISAAYVYGRIEFTGQTFAAGKNAFAEAMALEMDGVKTDLMVDVGRQVWGDQLGTLAQVATLTTASDTYLTVHNQFAKPGQPGSRHLSVGQTIQIGKLYATAAFATGAVISTLTESDNSGTTVDTITFTADISAAISASMILYNGAAMGIELMGVRGIVDDVTKANVYGRTGGYIGNDTLQNINRDTYRRWNAQVLENCGTARILDSYLMQKGFDKIKRATGKKPSLLIGEIDVMTAFWDSVKDDRRFATKGFDAGQDSVTFNGISIVQDVSAPYNELYLIPEGCLAWYVLRDFEFADDDGRIIKPIANYDKWEAFIRAYANLGAENVNGCCKIADIKTTF